MTSATIKELTEALFKASASVSPASAPLTDEERNVFYMAYELLRQKIETPIDAAARILFGGYDTVALQIAMDTGLLDQLVMAHGAKKTVAELSTPTKADPVLINRVLRLLAASNLVQETGPGEYCANSLTPAFSNMSPVSKSVATINSSSQSLVKLPEYLKSTKWQNPNDGWNGPFQFGLNTKDHYFEWLASDAKRQEAFNVHMQLQRMERGPDWFDFYPVEGLLDQDKHKDRPFLVDVGGGVGHDLAAFSGKYNSLTPRLILQDQEYVLKDVDNQQFKLDPQIQRQSIDFFKEQPVKGAKVYYLRTVIHDWPDKQAKIILKHIHDAMDDSSVLIINENALPNEKVIGFQARADFLMMSILSGIDRDRSQIESLLESSGFQVSGVWTPKVVAPGAGTVFEARKKSL